MDETAPALNPRSTRKRGVDKNGVVERRRTYDHGIPVAKVVVKLLGVPRDKRSQTVGQISQMLLHEYEALGVPPPHERNLAGIASGVRSAVQLEDRHLQVAKSEVLQ